MNRKEESPRAMSMMNIVSSSRRLMGAPPTMRSAVVKDLTRNDRKRSLNSHETEESGDEDEGTKTADEDGEEEETTKPAEESTSSSKPAAVKRRKKRRIRLTDQGLKAKRKAERREKLLAERKDREGELLDEDENDNKEEGDEVQKSNSKEDKEAEKPLLKSRPPPETLTPFQLFCENILRKLVLKDPEGYFTQPVTDEDAPDYREVIENPMDFSTIRDKIEQNLYEQFDEFRSDVELITNNAQIYNSPGSLFFLAAQKLATLARYYLSENYLKYLVYSLPFGREVPPEKLGLNLQTRINKEKSRHDLQKEREREKMRSMIKDTMNSKEIVQTSSKIIKNRLTTRRPNCHLAYLDNRDGAIALNVLTAAPGEETKQLKLGDYLKPLDKGTPGICTPFEPTIAQDYPISYTNHGPFASFAPQFDSTWATLSKRDSDLLFSCYGDRDNVSNVFSMRQMVENAGDEAYNFVEDILNEITDGEHSKTIAQLEGKTAEKAEETSSMNGRLHRTGKMLSELATMQNERLSRPPPTTLTNSLQPNGEEISLANEIAQELSTNIVELGAQPKDVVSSETVHQALGLDADDFEILSEFLEV